MRAAPIVGIIGPGYAAGREGGSRRKVAYTDLACVGSLVAAFVIGFVAYRGFATVGIT